MHDALDRITPVTGGVRSGSRRCAETLAARGQHVCAVATAEALDDMMAQGIAQQQVRRPAHGTTLESPHDVVSAPAGIGDTATVLDRCSLWPSNRLLALRDAQVPGWWQLVAALETAVTSELRAVGALARQSGWDLVLVSNEAGFGVVPATQLGRACCDLLGRLNQVAAADADAVYLLVAGLAVELQALLVHHEAFGDQDNLAVPNDVRPGRPGVPITRRGVARRDCA